MIQRIQTVYLLCAVALSIVCLCLPIGTFAADGGQGSTMYNLWLTDAAGGHSFTTAPLFVVQLVSITFGVYSVFLYGNRKVQARFCTFNALLLICWYAVYVAIVQILPSKDLTFHFPAPAVLPAVSMTLYLLARRRINADERLVRAADRIR